jgi:hypothetical protein
MSGVAVLLIMFSVVSSAVLVGISATHSGISAASGLTAFLLFLAVLMSVGAGVAVFASLRKWEWYVSMYQFACLCALGIMLLLLIAIAMTNLGNSSNPPAVCSSPTTYFEYQMLDLAAQATSLICTDACPCP